MDADLRVNPKTAKRWFLSFGMGFLLLALFLMGWKMGYNMALKETANQVAIIAQNCLTV